jgi:hypothetical protein
MKIQGYGVQLLSSEWADLLGIECGELLYYVEKKGLTIEELYKLRGRTFKASKTKRKPRVSEQMKNTQSRIGLLLEASGYIERNSLEDIEVRRVGTHSDHAVSFRGALLGVYNYKTGGLCLSSGEGLPLWDFDWEDAKVWQRPDGMWEVHADTKRLLLEKNIRTMEEDDPILRGLYETTKLKHGPEAETYEGFGRRMTCAKWARFLRVSQSTLWRHLQKGKTIEDFAAEKGIKINPSIKKICNE